MPKAGRNPDYCDIIIILRGYMSTYVLIHGGTCAGAIWDKVTSLLQNAGHAVYAPDLKGMGSRIDELSPEITLDDYIHDVSCLIKRHDLKDVILVGHSVAGLTITAVASQMPERIAKLVYLDALIPEVGSSAFSLLDSNIVDWLTRLANEGGDGWYYNPEQVTTLEAFPDKKERAWVLARRSPQPIKVQKTPVHFDPEIVNGIPRYYVYCSADGGMTSEFAKKAQRENWEYSEIDTGHMAMVTAPQELTKLLLALG